MPGTELQITAFDYLRGHQAMEQEIADAVLRVMRSGQLILGDEGQQFEREFCEFVGAEHGVGVGSGTDALILALLSLEIGPGDEVVTAANTAVPTAAAIRAVGAIPRFADIDPNTLLMDPDSTAAAINSKTRCLLPVHLHGIPADILQFRQLADQYGLSIVEDCAHAHGTRLRGQHVGTMGDIGCFSFYPTKNLGAYGDAGMCVTQNPALATRLRSLRMYGFDSDRIAQSDGRNCRLDELQAAILRVKLRSLPAAVRARQKIANQYYAGLACAAVEGSLRLPTTTPDSEHSFHQFVIRTDHRALLIDSLKTHRIGYGIHYDTPLHQMPAFRPYHEGFAPLPESDRAAARILSLPMYPELLPAETERVLEVVRAALARDGTP